MNFEKGDKVKWFEDRYSTFPNYGTIIKLNKKTATIKEDVNEFETCNVRVKYSDLNYN